MMTITNHISTETLGKKIRTLRRKQKLTQQELSTGIVTASMVSQIESDKVTPSVALLEQLASRLGVNIDYFEGDLNNKSDELQSYRSARSLMNAGRYAEAVDFLNTLSWPLSAQFKPEVVYNEIANCHIQVGDYERAVRIYEELIQVGYERNDLSTVVHAYYQVGLSLRRIGRHQVARMYWQRAIDLLSINSTGYMPIALKIYANLGRQYLQEENWSSSKAAYEEAIHLFQLYSGSLDLAKAYHGLACACMHLGDYEDALRHNDEAVAAHIAAENHKGAMRCRLNRGVILRHAKRFTEAKGYLRTLRSMVSQRDEVLFLAILHETATVAWQVGDFDVALKDSEMALQRKKIDGYVAADLHLIRANIHYDEHRFDLACREVKLGRELIEDDSPSALHIGFNEIERKCWIQAGRDADVISNCLEKALTAMASSTPDQTTNISA